MILVSYCKLGLKCTYKAGTNEHLPDAPFLKSILAKGLVIGVCPEIFGGLSTPRDPSEIRGGGGLSVLRGTAGVFSDKGLDVTRNFIAGAAMCADIAEKYDVRAAVLNECSPSCGVKYVYDGTFTKTRIEGPGVLGAMLLDRFGASFPLFGELDKNEESFLLNLFDKR
jgi:uncharacterized protein YbbK (DUF523 family)